MNLANDTQMRQLVETVVACDAQRPGILASGQRHDLITQLESCLLNGRKYRRFRQLSAETTPRAQRRGRSSLLHEEKVKAVLEKGLSVLNNDELIQLGINRLGLCQLFYEISKAKPRYWYERLKQELHADKSEDVIQQAANQAILHAYALANRS